MAGFQYEPYENRSLGSILDLMTRGPHAQAEAARAAAVANARAMEIRGQNTSQLVGSLGQIAAGVTNQVGQYYSPEAKLQRTQVEEQQRSIAEDHALRALFADGRPRPEDIYRVVGPKRGVDIVKGLAALSEQNIKTDDAIVGKIADLTAGVLAWPEAGRPEAYQHARQHLVQLGVPQEQIPEQYSETFVRQAQQAALTSKDRMAQTERAARDAETARHNGVMENRPISVGAGATLYAPKEQTPIFTAPKVETPVSLQAKDALLDGKPASVTFNPHTGRYLDASGQDVTARVKPIPPASVQNAANAQQAIEIKPGTPTFKTAQDLAYGRLTFSQFRTLVAYGRDTNVKMAIYAKAAELNPEFNAADFERGYKFISSPRVASQLASLDNVASGVDDLISASNQAARFGATQINKFGNKVQIALGNKKFTNLRTAQVAFADELSGALGYGSATDMSREMGFNMTDPNLSPDNFSSAIRDIVMPFVERKRASLLKQGSIYGKSENNSAITPVPAHGVDSTTVNVPAAPKKKNPFRQ